MKICHINMSRIWIIATLTLLNKSLAWMKSDISGFRNLANVCGNTISSHQNWFRQIIVLYIDCDWNWSIIASIRSCTKWVYIAKIYIVIMNCLSLIFIKGLVNNIDLNKNILMMCTVAIYFHLYADCILFYLIITTMERSYNKTYPSFSWFNKLKYKHRK